MRRPRVLLLADSQLFQSALASYVQRLGFSVSVSPRRRACRKDGTHVDVVVVDVATFIRDASKLRELVEAQSRVAPVLLVAREDHVEHVLIGLKAGATGFIEQCASPRTLRNAILTLAVGNTWFDTKTFRKVMKFLPTLPSLQQQLLTKREKEVLGRVSLGQSNKEIAQQLCLSEQSVKVYVSNLLRKTGAANRSALALYAIMRGLESAEEVIK